MAAKSKAYRAAAEKIEEGKFYSPTEAVAVARETGSKKFDSTVEVALKLGVDPRKADQMVRGTVILPHGTGKTARVIVFATGPAAEAALAAGADGLLIEVHHSPETALCDGAQSLLPSQFEKLMDQLSMIAPAIDRTLSKPVAV